MSIAAALALLVVFPSPSADDPFPQPPPLQPVPPMTPPVLLSGKVVKDKFVYGETALVPFMRMVDSPQPGSPATQLVYLIQTKQVAVPLKGAKATDAAGKVIPFDKLAERLKDEAIVVVTYGADVEPKFRTPFKEGTVFLMFPTTPKKEDVIPKEPVP